MSGSRYALLMAPSANRVYAENAAAMTEAELGVFGATVVGSALLDVERVELGGVGYVVFTTSSPLAARDVAYLSNLSAMYALFTLADDESLRPVTLERLDRFDDDLITIQKYAGKTNEQFTKLLLNVTVASSRFGPEMLERRVAVFDPLCGRGTTLNQALMYGWDAAGMDLDGRDVEAYRAFLETWLRRRRLKHATSFAPVRRDKKLVGRRLEVDLAAEREAYKSGDRQRVVVVDADTTRAGGFFRPSSFDVIVTDAPYGVRHGSRAGGTDAELSRRPLALLRAAVPGWVPLLRPGGALGVAWNALVARRSEVRAVLEDAGLEVCVGPAYESFEHRVDQGITRDLVVAVRP